MATFRAADFTAYLAREDVGEGAKSMLLSVAAEALDWAHQLYMTESAGTGLSTYAETREREMGGLMSAIELLDTAWGGRQPAPQPVALNNSAIADAVEANLPAPASGMVNPPAAARPHSIPIGYVSANAAAEIIGCSVGELGRMSAGNAIRDGIRFGEELGAIPKDEAIRLVDAMEFARAQEWIRRKGGD